MRKMLFIIAALLCTVSMATVHAQATGFTDGFSDGRLNGWDIIGNRNWTENSGKLVPANASGSAGFAINQYPCSDNGTFTAEVTADQWNGYEGGLVVRYTNDASYYYFAVRPGLESSSGVYYCKDSMNIWSGTAVKTNFQINTQCTLSVQCTGATFRISLDGVFIGEVTDSASPHLYGKTGFAHSTQWNGLVSFDNATWVDAPGSGSTIASNPNVDTTASAVLKVFFKDEGFNENNITKVRIYVENAGTVDAKNFVIYYYFTIDAGKTPVLEDYYTPDCAVSLDRIDSTQYRVKFDYFGITLKPGQVTPDRSGTVVGIRYSDWSQVNKTDDFSYIGTDTFTENNNMPIFTGSGSTTSGTGTGPGTTTGPTLVGGNTLPITVKVKKVKIVSLYCHDTEDTLGDDECILDITIDGHHKNTITNNMTEGRNWAIDLEYEMKNIGVVSLTDDDSPDDDDFLGSVSLSQAIGTHTGKINGDGSDYTLTYEVSEFDKVVPSVMNVNRTTVTVTRLHCSDTEDTLGEDELALYMTCDGLQLGVYTHDLNEGDDWNNICEFEIDSACIALAHLGEIDGDFPGDDEDDLGTITFDLSTGDHTAKFTQDGADYTIYYSVSSAIKTVSVKTDEEIALDAFKASTAGGLWPNIDKAKLIEDIDRKIHHRKNPIYPTFLNDPSSLPNQKSIGFCGPASILYELIKRDPLRYVDMCRTVYEEAKFYGKTRTLVVDTDEDVLKSKVPDDFQTNQADWMTMAFMRDEENWFWDVDADGNVLANGVTTPWEMKEWIEEILCYVSSNFEETFFYGELDALDEVRKTVVQKGGVGFLMIKSELIKGEEMSIFPFPEHWIAVTGDVSIDWGDWYDHDSGHVKFRYFSWAKDTGIVDCSEGYFEEGMYGAVLGQ